MAFNFNIYVGILSVTAIVAIIVAWATGQRRSTSSARIPFLLMMVAIAFYASISALEAGSVALRDKIFWCTLEYTALSITVVLFLLFVLHFTHHQRWLTHFNTGLLWLLPVLNTSLVATNSWHHLVWTDFIPHPLGINFIIYENGSGFYGIAFGLYTCTLTGVYLLIQSTLRFSHLYRFQSLLMLTGALIPVMGGTAYILELTPAGFNITPVSFMLTGLLYFISFFQLHLFDLVPIARDILVENMQDGVLVLDQRHRIIDLNPSAQLLLHTNTQCIGQPITQILSQWDEIRLDRHGNTKVEFCLDPNLPCYVEIQIMPLSLSRQRRLTGYLLNLRDITQRYQAETQLRQLNQQLQAQLQQVETLQVKLQEQAIRDGLTGLYNRRYLDETLPRELARVTRENVPMAILLLDIDHFKKINDTFGHQVGDQVLQSFAQLLQRHSRKSDLPCRYGGEEFVLAIPGITLELALQRAEEIRNACQNLNFRVNQQLVPTTVSGGLVMFPRHGLTPNTLFRNADLSLYQAKAQGRNQIRIHGT